MSKTIAWTSLIALATILIAVSTCHPYYLSDAGNSFFKSFVNHELLSVLGVIFTITLASAASLHLELNKIEERTGEQFLPARGAIKASAYSLVAAFALAFCLVVVKPIVATNQHWSALLNSAVVLIFVFNIAILADLTAAVFRIPALRR